MGNQVYTSMKKRLAEYTEALGKVYQPPISDAVITAIGKTTEAYRNGKTVYVCGNGGSAADSQHFAAELNDTPNARFPAIFLGNASSLTALGNDYGFETVFERQLRTLGRRVDVLYGISTSGKATNVQRAMDAAKEIGIYRIGIVGNGPKSLEIISRSDTAIVIPSADTQIIQQCYYVVLHDIWIELKKAFGV